jgi:RNA polymerase sigma-70 factor (ECF subfamily)
METYGQSGTVGTAPSERRGQVTGASSPEAADLAFLDRMRAGDERGLAELYDRWSDRVHSLAEHLLRDARDAEDIVEETFWQAWRSAARYDASRGAVGTWLLTICRSRALDKLRARRRRPEDASLDESPAVADSAADPADTVVAGETGRIVRAALKELPNEQRQALELAYFRGLSQSEIAEKTGQPLGTIKTRMRLAMNKLRERLAPLREVHP